MARRRKRRRGRRRRRNPGIGIPMLIGAAAGVLLAEGIHRYVTPIGDNMLLRDGIGAGIGAGAGYLLG